MAAIGRRVEGRTPITESLVSFGDLLMNAIEKLEKDPSARLQFQQAMATAKQQAQLLNRRFEALEEVADALAIDESAIGEGHDEDHHERHLFGEADAFAWPDHLDIAAGGLREALGPTLLQMGDLLDGQFIRRLGSNLVGGVPQTRTFPPTPGVKSGLTIAHAGNYQVVSEEIIIDDLILKNRLFALRASATSTSTQLNYQIQRKVDAAVLLQGSFALPGGSPPPTTEVVICDTGAGQNLPTTCGDIVRVRVGYEDEDFTNNFQMIHDVSWRTE